MKRRVLGLATGLLLLVGLVVAVASALTATDSQANQPQVAGQPASNTTARFPTNKQNEPTIAVNPVDGQRLIAGSNDEQLQPPCGPGPVRGATADGSDCSFFPGVGTDGVYTSSNGGLSWTNRGLLPGFSDNGGSLVSDGDPVIVYGPKLVGGTFTYGSGARAYYASLASYAPGQAQGNQAPELITVSASDDDGVTWSGPVVAADSHGYNFNDKNAAWVDRNPNSPYFGRVYVSWTEFRGITECAQPVFITYSADAGRTWSNPNQLSPATCAKGGRQGTSIRTGPDGTVYVVWEDSDNAGPKQVVSASTNGGKSFSKARDIAPVKDIAAAIPGSNFRTDSFASLGVDQGNGAVYAAWADGSVSPAPIVVYRAPAGGVSWTKVGTLSHGGYAFFQGLDVAPNGRIDVGWQEQVAVNPATYGTGNASIDAYYSSSSNGGASWSPATRVSTRSSDPAASAQNNLELQFWGDYNTLVSTNTRASFIYTDTRNGVGCPAVDAYQHGLDGTGPAVAKPAPPTSCPSQFGNSDVFVSTITP